MPRPFDLLPPLLDGLWVTVQLMVGGAAIAAVMACVAGLAVRSGYRILQLPALVYIEVFRGTSALVQLYWFFYALPLLGFSLSAMAAGILVLGLNIGSYGAEVVRGALGAVPRGQHEACTALNLPPMTRFMRVIAPQALVRILPPVGNLSTELLKGTSLVSLITLSDLTFRGMMVRTETLRTAEVFGLLLLIYFGIALAMTSTVRRLEKRLKRGWHLEALR